jgi:cell wall assembly regulator SMI1
MKTHWERIEAWLAAHARYLLRDLRKGAEPPVLAKVEAQIQRSLPETLRAFYAVHDGQMSQCPQGLFYSLRFMPLARVLEAQRVWAELVDINDELAHAMRSSPSRYIKPVYANPLWIPFADDQSGNHLGVDLDPNAEGSDGQVIVFGRDENRKRLVAQSFEDFIDIFVAQLEAGNFVIQEKILAFKTYLDGELLPAHGRHPLDVFGRESS